MRLFIAINISIHNKNKIKRYISYFRQEIGYKLKWVRPKNLHITLKFLGDVDVNFVDLIIEKINIIAGKSNLKSARIGEFGAFPALDYPRIIYIGISAGTSQLIDLHQDLDNELKKIGFKKDKKTYTPHITIARARRNTNIKKLAIRINKYLECNKTNGLMSLDLVIDKISLMKSTLTPEGAVYEEIYTADLV